QKSLNILIVEDQCFEVLEEAVHAVAPNHFSEHTCDLAKTYVEARQTLCEKQYDIILLDHRLPLETLGEYPENIGYSLIPSIKEQHPCTLIIGTSSLTASALRGAAQPDERLPSKLSTQEATEGLTHILDRYAKNTTTHNHSRRTYS
ncbi:hypothetical protein D6774_04280, partial [Candidatus Woesearchaeota archaeon]